ncbi:hypothetical protein O7635_13355 [Asanoa sp. WMMD1127]|uniref:hypothetical protein n=1 Tax=Asanoa sp. WMMD1127 TaxID=3016107 RepID=UPI0024163A94|nr:hypothetical protein [Asanoa sp. WMMD1127]MDG4822837.1 hypothetical protein [Asanoa sp. WMMD1127]
MRDEIDLAQRLAADLGRVEWANGEELRRIGRRRSRRAALSASLCVLLLFSGIWIAATRPFQQPAEQVDLFGAAGAPAVPEPVATTIGPQDPAWIPPEALLTPEDVAPGLIATDVSVDQNRPVGDWVLPVALCNTYATVPTYQGVYQFRRQQTVGYPPKVPGEPKTALSVLRQTVMRLPGDVSRQLVAEAVQLTKACPKYVADGTLSADDPTGLPKKVRTTHAWVLVDQGFAGDDSLLFQHRVTAMTGQRDADLGASAVLVIRVGDLVATVEQVGDEGPAVPLKLATRAAAWLCTAATPPC